MRASKPAVAALAQRDDLELDRFVLFLSGDHRERCGNLLGVIFVRIDDEARSWRDSPSAFTLIFTILMSSGRLMSVWSARMTWPLVSPEQPASPKDERPEGKHGDA